MKKLADEEMKVQLNDRGGVTLITKLMEPETAAGEYIGVARIPGSIAGIWPMLSRPHLNAIQTFITKMVFKKWLTAALTSQLQRLVMCHGLKWTP